MRDHYDDFTSRNAEIITVGPDSIDAFKEYWTSENIPYFGLSDLDHTVARLYRQEIVLFKAGRMPLNCVIDMNGRIRYIHFGANMTDIPDNEIFLNVIDQLNGYSK
jgi:peroxiredoxin Q/BCP